MAINGFSTCNLTANGSSFRVPGTRRALRVRREIAPLLIGFAAEFHDKVQPIDAGILDDWGYYCRRVRGRSLVSFHAAGLAIDLNSTRHPLGRAGTFNARQRATIRVLCAKYGLRWGGDYRGRKDEMHFEVILPRSEALALVKRLQSKKPEKPATAKPTVIPRLSKLKYGATNSDIVLMQKRLNKVLGTHLETDGVYGPHTKNAVQQFQRSRHQNDPDGFMGPVTLSRLF